MKVVPPTPPAERKTQVALSDREIALITHALFGKNETVASEGNDDLWADFDNLRIDLNIDSIEE